MPLSEGAWLRDAVRKSGLSAADFAAKLGISRATLFAWCQRPVIDAPLETLYVAAELAGVRVQSLRRDWHEESDRAGDPYRQHAIERQHRYRLWNHVRWAVDDRWRRRQVQAGAATADDLAADPLDANLDPYSGHHLLVVPTFHGLTVAAGGWSDVSEAGEAFAADQIRQGLFRVCVRGDSMTPDWREGDCVEFRLLRVGLDELKIGRDYYVQRDDHLATFKRLVAVEDDQYVLQAINRRRYPARMPIARECVVRMGLAVGKFVPIERN